MNITEYMEQFGHEQLAIWTDPAVGLRAFIAVHDTTLGPALGGVRIWPYPNEDAALMDVLRLAKAMTYKSALAGLPLGGGKGLIVADPQVDKTEAMFRSYGRFVESLGGRYITTEDVGAGPQDIEWISYETKYVVGLPQEAGGSGNPALITGFGIFQAMRACARATWGDESLEGSTVAIQGYGNVASALASHLVESGAKLIITDIRNERLLAAQSLGPAITLAEPEAILASECDILAPCALGGVLNAKTIPELRCKVICGGANNQLGEDRDASLIAESGILYAPDYMVNAGGVINVFCELGTKYDQALALRKASKIYDTTLGIIKASQEQGITTVQAANNIAEARLAQAHTAA